MIVHSNGDRSARVPISRVSAASTPTTGSGCISWIRVQVVPQSNMPGYPWLASRTIDGNDVAARMRTLKLLGDPYSDADIAAAPNAVKGATELDALMAYLQGLGIKNEPLAVAATGTPAGASTPAVAPEAGEAP